MMLYKGIHQYVLALILGLVAFACSNLRAEQVSTNEAEARTIAEKFVADRYPDFDNRKKKPVLKDGGDHWEFTYELPDDMIGGAPVVIIDKRTKKIIRSYRTQ